MIKIFICVLILILILNTIIKKDFVNPVTIFLSVWIFSLFLTSLNLYGIIGYTNKALITILLGIVSFIIGTLLHNFFYNNKEKSNKKYYANYKMINFFLIIGIATVCTLSIVVIKKMLNGIDYAQIRTLYYSYGGESLIKSSQLFTMFDWYNSIINTVISPLIIIKIVKNDIPKKTIILFIIYTILFAFCTSGRMQILMIIFELVFAIILYKKRINKKMIQKVAIVSFTLIVTICFLTVVRSQNSAVEENKVNDFYAYGSLPLPYFSRMERYIDDNNFQTYGLATFYGPYLLVQKSCKLLLGFKFSNADELFSMTTAPQTFWIKAFSNSDDYYNAYATMFYNFYLDFGTAGIIIFSIIYGFFMEYIYCTMKNNTNDKNVLIYIIFILGMIKSFVSWQFASPAIIISIIIMRLFFKQEQVTEDD